MNNTNTTATKPLEAGVIYKVSVSPVSHYYAVIEPTNNTGWYKYYTQKRARAAHPEIASLEAITESDFIFRNYVRSLTPVVVEPKGPATGTWFLKCENCGEVFDDIEFAVGHDGEDMEGIPCHDERHKPTYTLVPEEEAF